MCNNKTVNATQYALSTKMLKTITIKKQNRTVDKILLTEQ